MGPLGDLPAGTRVKGLLLLAVLTVVWGLAWPLMKAVLADITPWTFRFIVVPTSGMLLLALAALTKAPLRLDRSRWLPLVVVSFINVTGWQVFSAFGLAYLSAGRAVLVAYTMPLWASVLGAFVLREPFTWRIGLALAFGMTGVGVLIGDDSRVLAAAPVGLSYMLCAAFSWGLGVVLMKRVAWGIPTLSLAAWQLLVGSVPILILAPMVDDLALFPMAPKTAFLLLLVVLGPMSFCAFAWFTVVSLFPANISAIGTLMIPVIGVISGSLLLGEAVGWQEGSALALIGSALALTLFGRWRR